MNKQWRNLFVVLVLGMSLLIPTKAFAAKPEKAFKDVSIYFWAKPHIDHLVGIGAIDGAVDGTFGVGKNVTRAQASKIIVESLQLELVATENQVFTDVEASHWAKKYIETLAAKGIINGYEDGTFRPNHQLSRSQMAKILANGFALKNQAKQSFKDVPTHHWAHEYVMKLAASGMTTGYPDQTYRPNHLVTREQMTAFVSRGLAKREGITLPTVPKKPAQTNKFPHEITINDPIRTLPRPAVLKEYDRSHHRYDYQVNLRGGGKIKRVTLLEENERLIMINGTGKDGREFVVSYSTDRYSLIYWMESPKLEESGLDQLKEEAEKFARSYGWQDDHHRITFTIFTLNESEQYTSHTNAKTLGEELDRRNQSASTTLVFKQTPGGRIIHSYMGIENNEHKHWVITSDDCSEATCTQNIDAIRIDKEKEFKLVYKER